MSAEAERSFPPLEIREISYRPWLVMAGSFVALFLTLVCVMR